MPRTPSAFPFSGRLKRRAINPTPPKRVKAWGEGPLRPEVMYPVVETPRPNRAARNHSRSRAPHHRTQENARQERAVVFVAASHQTRLDTRSKARRPIKVGIKGRGRSGTSRDSNPACQCCSSAHLVQCEPDEASSFTNPNVGPGTYASLRLKLDAWSSAVQRGQKSAARPPEGCPAEAGAYSAPSLLLVSSAHPARMPDGPAKKPGSAPFKR